jgi:hypothetical protein
MAHDEGDLRFGARLDEALADVDRVPVCDPHAVGQESKVRLVHAEHVLHRGAGHADLLADDALTGTLAPCQDAERDRVGVIEGKLRMTLAQRPHRAPLQQRLVQLRGQLLVQRAARLRF